MKKLISMLAVLVLLAACSKDKTVSPPVPQPAVAKRITHIEYVESPESSLTFKYDSQGRIISSETSTFLATLEYKPGGIAEYTGFLKSENRVYSTATLTLNNKGFATSMDMTYHPTVNTTKNYQYSYTYDASGNLIKVENQQNPGALTIVLNWVNGNIADVNYATNNNAPYTSWKYFYGNDPDKLGINRNFTLYSNVLGGNLCKNVYTKAERYNGNNVKIDEETCTFEFDADGYLVKKTSYFQAGNTTEHTLYTFQ